MKNKKIILILGVLVIFIIALGCLFNSKNSSSLEDVDEIVTIPVRFNEIPVELNISKDKKLLEAKYTNSSIYDISNLVLEVKLKDTDEKAELKCNELVKVGEQSGVFTGKLPKSGKVEDVEILKYKISLSKGIYMEYDVQLNQYNWS